MVDGELTSIVVSKVTLFGIKRLNKTIDVTWYTKLSLGQFGYNIHD
ncbi:MAG: hypothetical protein WAJ93_23880 [Candidatus Nitrosopolaris sp.]